MKNEKSISFVVLLVIASLSCKFLVPSSTDNTNSPSSTNNPSNAPSVDFEKFAEPLNVTVQLDDASTISSTITSTGGSLSLTAADGSVFTLDVPAKALAADTLITMTAVKSMEGAPLDSNTPAAVKLEPSGLFFSEVVTLTIIPAQEIPIENQIIFGYEGDGQDYHLVVVDPKSKEIKIKLMEFSGAGVGSGGDAAWAANLQIEASASSTRLMDKFAEAAQVDRKANLLEGDESSNQLGENAESILNQFYDQVVLKEMAAAELDCQFAKQASHDLVTVERLRQLADVYPGQPIMTEGFNEKLAKLQKIYDECKKAYHISGAFGEVGTVEGNACDVTKPFKMSGAVCMFFTPADENGGSFTYSCGPFGAEGSGTYTIGNGSMQISGAGTLGTDSNSGSLTFTVTPIDPASCVP